MSLFGHSDIIRAAKSMIQDYGRKAAQKAAEEASKAEKQKRSTATTVWKQVEREIKRLQAEAENSR